MSASDRAALDQWKGKLLKTCDANEIFRGKSDDGLLLDATQVAAKTGKSYILQANGEVAILGRAQYPSGTEETSLSQTQSDANSSYTLDAKTSRKGGNCEVIAFGQTLYRVSLMNTLTVVVSIAPAALPVSSTRGARVDRVETNAALGQYSGDGFSSATSLALKPVESAWELVEQTFGLDAAAAKKYFPLYGSLDRVILTLSDLPSTAPFKGGHFAALDPVIGDLLEMAPLGSPNGHVYTISAVFPILDQDGHSISANSDNFGDAPLWSATLNIRTQVVGSQTEYAAVGISSTGPLAYDQSKAVACFQKRYALLGRGMPSGDPRFFPAYYQSEGPCGILVKDFTDTFLDSSDMLALIQRKFAGVTAASVEKPTGLTYQYWDWVLKIAAGRIFRQGKVIADVLDANGSMPIVQTLSHQAEVIRAPLALDRKPSDVDSLLDIEMGWAFDAITVPDADLLRILAAAKNSDVGFPASTHRFISGLDSDPLGTENSASLAYAESITPAMTTAAAQILTASVALGQEDWANGVLGKAIQNHLSMDRLNAMNVQIGSAQAFATRDRARKASTESLFDSDLKTIIERALGESWVDPDYANVEAIATVSRTNPFCQSTDISVSSLVRCGGHADRFTKKTGGVLDPNYGDRYARASAAFQAATNALSDNEFYSDRYNLQNAFFAPVWKGCAPAEFDAHVASLPELAKSIVAADFSNRYSLETKLRNALNDCSSGNF